MMPNFVIRNVKKGFAGHREIFMMSLWWQKKNREKLLDASKKKKKKTKLSL
jgi:hypothetical protein